jgi:hypothetical protein
MWGASVSNKCRNCGTPIRVLDKLKFDLDSLPCSGCGQDLIDHGRVFPFAVFLVVMIIIYSLIIRLLDLNIYYVALEIFLLVAQFFITFPVKKYQ